MKVFPLFFSHGGMAAGRGFLAHVEIHGRLLLEETDKDFFSFFGVNPGGVAGQGSTQVEARRDFLEEIRLVVFDLAAEASSFPEFRELVEEFVRDTNKPTEALWLEAVQGVRSGAIDKSGFSTLLPAERPSKAVVRLIHEFSPSINPDLNQSEQVGIAACG